jgi:transcriptional regulator with XRE-family HTH domain
MSPTPTLAALVVTRHRERLGWSKRRLSRETNYSAPYIVQVENGERPATAKFVARVADAIGLPPYVLLGEAGFIPADHVTEAETMAAEAMNNKKIAFSARGGTSSEKKAWLVADYLYLLGDDPYASGWKYGPGGNHIDWTPFSPERAAVADANPLTATMRERRVPLPTTDAPKPMPTPIEGWDELSGADQTLVQRLVNRLRRAATDDES